MIVKGIISAIYQDQNKLSVILPEYDNMTTQPLQIYGTSNMSDYAINDFVIVFVFNDDFNDAVVLPKGASSLPTEYIVEAMNAYFKEIETLIDESGVLDYDFT